MTTMRVETLSVMMHPPAATIQMQCRKALVPPTTMSVQRKVFARMEEMLESGDFGSVRKFRKMTWTFAPGHYLPVTPRANEPRAKVTVDLVYADTPEGAAQKARDTDTLNSLKEALNKSLNGPVTTFRSIAEVYLAVERMLAAETTFRRKNRVGILKSQMPGFNKGVSH